MTADAERFDLIVIGGGVNGAGIARDAAKRGLSVALFEKDDFCSGTSAWSSRLIHGGLRYLEYLEIPLVFESLNERRHLQRIARHLVKPIRIAIPVYAGARRGRGLIRLGLVAYDLLSIRKRLPNHDMLGRHAALRAEPGLEPEGLRGLARYYDAQVAYAERLVVENLLDARSHGAVLCNHCPVIEILEKDGVVTGVAWRDPDDDARHEAWSAAVINAAGPWVDAVLDTAGVQERDFIGGTKGSHIIVSPFRGAPRDAIYVEAAEDGRPFFILPWNGLVLIGTTDLRYEGDLDSARISPAEVDYLLAETNRVFPGARLSAESVHYAYAGVRPLPWRDSGPESAITRKHQVVENTDIARGLYSIIGGKLTTYRNLAEHAVDRVVADKRLPQRDCTTATDALPGAVELEAATSRLATTDFLSSEGRERLLAIYGGRASAILDGIEQGGLPGGTLGDGGRILCAEVAFAVEREFARNLRDIVFRRLMIGFDPDQGRACYEEIASLAADRLGWSEERRDRELERLVRYADSFRIAG